MVTRRTLFGVGVMLGIAACKPEFAERAAYVRQVRVLAIRSEPAEWTKVLDPDTGNAKPATFRALVASPQGTNSNANLAWAFCTLPKPLTELNDVSVECLHETADYVVQIGSGPVVQAPLPDNDCRQFGPDVPEEQGFRPADPDVTGGYYQPIRAFFRPDPNTLIPALGKVRIKCGLPGATQEQIALYNRRYHPNTNPTIERVEALVPTGVVALIALEDDPAAAPLVLPPGLAVELRVAWPACPVVDACGDGFCGPTESKDQADPRRCDADCAPEHGCGGAERYLAFDLETRTLGERRESMRVSWFATEAGGTIADDRSGAAEDDTRTFASNVYTAPTAPGEYPLWVVLRDARGGITWKSLRVRVSP